MGKNVIVSEQTVRDLLEAYASLAAWYYQLWGALRSGGASPEHPSETQRAAFLERFAQDYPELAQLARSIQQPRPFVPPPPALPVGTGGQRANEDAATIVEPAPARSKEVGTSQPPAASGGIAPPPFIPPGTVKY
ncbi:MAG: hypothetical protein IPK82_02055 [Polyangiaceae bacterium]|nr:hypothetical protein [Polyangiaceae bacterium]